MPTFASIGVHPELRSRIVSVSTLQASNGEQHQPIETPQALLSRNPNSICLLDKKSKKAKSLPLAQIKQLRQDVALAMVAQSRPGKRARHIHNVLDPAEDLMFPGTVSALNLLRYDRMQAQRSGTMSPLSTQCPALDELLGLPVELQRASYSSIDYSSLSSPERYSMSPDRQSHSVGLLYGYVTQFYGPPACGKTQLCLHMAAKAVSRHPNAETFYISSSGALSCLADRLAYLARHSIRQNGEGEASMQPDYMSVLQSTRLMHVGANAHQVLFMLDQVEAAIQNTQTRASDSRDSVQEEDASFDHNDRNFPTLLIMDSASGCLAGASHELLLTIGLKLKQLARHYSVAVLVTNTRTSNSTMGRAVDATDPPASIRCGWKPALGQAWNAVADIQVRLELESQGPSMQGPNSPSSVHEGTVVRACLESHIAKAASGHTLFAIDGRRGIVPIHEPG